MTWSKPDTKGKAPIPRAAHSTVFIDGKLYVFGGFDGKLFYNDLHVLELGNHLIIISTITTSFTTSVISHHSSLITHHSSLISHHSSLITHHSSLITHLFRSHHEDTFKWLQV